METEPGGPMEQSPWMIEVVDVSRSFGEVHALSGVSFEAAPGEIVGLLGPNGAGKTTLVRILATLLRADSGTVRVGGVDVRNEPQRARQLLGLAGQAAAVDEMLTGRENLHLVGALYGLERDVCRARAVETLERFGLTDAADRRAGTYSGGMRRRLDLAATMIGDPSVVLLDEPTAGLDPRSRAELWDLVASVAASGTTVLLTTQYLEEVERLADRVVVLDRGVVIADAPPDDLKAAMRTDVLEARVASSDDVDAAAAVLARVGDVEPVIDLDERRISMAISSGVGVLVAAARGLDDAAIELVDLGVRRPSLDDVFLAITGDADTIEPIHVGRDVERASTPRPDRAPRGRHGWRDMAAVTGRYLRRFTRIPEMYIFNTSQPIFFVIVMNAVFGGVVARLNGEKYIQYLVPGIVIMNILFGASITSNGFAQDLEDGIIDRFRSLPISRSAVLVGRTIADLTRSIVAMSMVVGVGLLLGFRFHGSVAAAIGAGVLALSFGFAISWVFACIGMAVRDPQAAQLAGFLPALPMVFLSGTFIPVDTMSGALQAFARNQPVNVLVEAIRALVDGTPTGSWLWQAIAWTAGLFALSVPLALRLYRGDGS